MKNRLTKRSRRDFIKKGVAGIAGAVLLPDMVNRDRRSLYASQKDKCIYRTLGKTGLKIPIVSIGGPDNPSLIKAALDKGIKHINTSPDYRNGNQEIMIGRTLKNWRRDEYIVATGFSMWRRPQNQIKNYAKEDIIRSFEASLKRLDMDYVDIYYLLGVAGRESVLHAPFQEAMNSIKKSGKTRFIGITVHQNEPEVLHALKESNLYDIVLTAHNFRKIYKEEIKKGIAAVAKAGLGVVAMKTQAGVYWDHKTKDKINMKAALKWVLQDENVHTTVPAFATIDELQTGISVMENLELTPEETKDLKLTNGFSHSGLYCQHCQKCISQCNGDFDIPTLMRSYMYVYGYKNPLMAKEAVQHIDTKQVKCTDCTSCTVKCTMGFNVREKILSIIRIKGIPDDFLHKTVT